MPFEGAETTETSQSDAVPPKRKEGIQVQQFGKEVVLYDEAAKRVHVLNRTAQFIWDRCDGATTVRELVAAMVQTFSGVSEDVLQRDVEATLRRFWDERLVEGLASE